MVTVTAKWDSRTSTIEAKLSEKFRELHSGVTDRVLESIVEGSPVTGSPGQPEDLRQGQWTRTDEGPLSSVVSTDDPSAPAVEDGISHFNGAPIELHSNIGGFHSIAATAMHFDKLVEDEAKSAGEL